MPSAADYAWFDQDNELVNGFSLSWVRNVAPEDVVARLDGTPIRRSDWEGLYEDPESEQTDGPAPLAIASIAGWSMLLDIPGWFGIEQEPLRRLSQGTTVIYQFLSVNLDDRYRLVEDGTVRVGFEPSAPDFRRGSSPDVLVDAMAHVGFAVTQPGQAANPPDRQPDPTETAFALTEYLTGIRLSMELLESQSYLLAQIPRR
jgi:Family of unknown function (DUF6461)